MAISNFKQLTKAMDAKRRYFWKDDRCLYEEAAQWERFPKFMIRARNEFEQQELTHALRAEGFIIGFKIKRKENQDGRDQA